MKIACLLNWHGKNFLEGSSKRSIKSLRSMSSDQEISFLGIAIKNAQRDIVQKVL